MWNCEWCGAGDCCERTDCLGSPVLCDECYAMGQTPKEEETP